MKIIIVNKFYYNRGGDCIATMALENTLRKHGHEVAIFSMSYPKNIKTEWDRYFAPQVDFSAPGISKLKAVARIFKPGDVKKRFLALIKDFAPDIVHLNNIHSYLSPYIAEIAYKQGIKVVWTLHDYKLICPSYICLNNGQVCTDCIKSPLSVCRNKCMKNSFLQSVMGYLEASFWNKDVLDRYVDKFIAPSDFMRKLMVFAGFKSEKFYTLPHYMSRGVTEYTEAAKENYYCFIGRFSKEKGIETLIKVANRLPYKLLLVGDGPLKDDLELMADKDKVSFLGFKEWDELQDIIKKAKFVVIPSEWYEVFGLVSIEAQALGTPVLGANIGGIPETINSNYSGLLFESGNESDLENKINTMFNTVFDYQAISNKTIELYSEDVFYKRLMNIYGL